MRMISIDLRGQEGKLINFSVWNGIAAPEGHIKLVLKVTLPPEKGMMGTSKYHREDVKWDGTDKGLRQNILAFLSRGKARDNEFDIRQASYKLFNLFV